MAPFPVRRFCKKKISRALVCVTILFANGSGLLAQTPCFSEHIRQQNFARFPELKLQYQVGLATQDTQTQVRPRTVTTIPVVVHVVYKGNLENISESQIQSQLDVLNEDYRHLNPNSSSTPLLFASLAADMELEFCLAAYDPSGNPTSGITRRETAWNNIGQLFAPDGRRRIHFTDLGGEDAWDPAHYLNIWVCNIGGGILGFGTYPGTAPFAEDGVVIDPRYFGTTGLAVFYPPHHLGRTATHEIGHYFNLRHIFGDDENSCQDDDDVADTPTQRAPYLGCPAFPQLSCGNSAMFMNFMDYTDDACMSLFTEGQKTRLWLALNTSRSGLLDSNSCSTSRITEIQPAEAELHLYPNPVSEKLNIQHVAFAGEAELRVFDFSGKLYLQQKCVSNPEGIQINFANAPTGIYRMLLVFSNGMATGIFAKN